MLRTVLSSDIASLDAHVFAGGAADTLWLIYERLTAYDLTLKPQPVLAESWDASTDFKKITFHIRKGVQFHSGREFTSDDVKYNLLRVRDPKVGAGLFVNQSNWFTGIDTPDKYTIVLSSDQPRPLAFDLFERLYMVDKDIMEGPDAKTKANGTGPFTFVEWAQGDHFTLAKNKNYWQTGKPYLDGVRVSIVKDTQALVSQFEGGAFDIARSIPLLDFVRLRGDAKYQTLPNKLSTSFHVIGANIKYPPFDNKVLRQALNYAIDRKRFVDTVLQGNSTPSALPWDPAAPANEPAKQTAYGFDLDKAKSLLAQSGVNNLEMDITIFPNAEGPAFSQIYQGDLAKLGIKLNLKTPDQAALLDLLNNDKYRGLYYLPAARAASPGSELSTDRVYDPKTNISGYKSDTYSQLVDAASTEADPAKLQQVTSKVNDLLLDESFAMPLAPTYPTTLMRANVQGAANTLFSGYQAANIWLA
ncbi:MAG: ABC transporter substrate-binding protein [Chloroflexi bacterium]|nr:ABC transporter substrate-binding protein [Chloroflexota bacterium]